MEYEPINHEKYIQMKEHALKDPESFWIKTATEVIDWIQSDFTNVIGEIGDESSFWFDGGIMNTCYNAVDRHAARDPNKIALLYEGNYKTDKICFIFLQLMPLH